MIQVYHPHTSNIQMAECAAVDGIRVQCNRLMEMNLGTVMVPVAAMFVRPSQMRMRRRPLRRHEDGQEDEINRRAKVSLDQEDRHEV